MEGLRIEGLGHGVLVDTASHPGFRAWGLGLPCQHGSLRDSQPPLAEAARAADPARVSGRFRV